MGAAAGSLVLLLLAALCAVASAQTGYFEVGGTGSSCTESEPCADPFVFLASNVFEEYVLAAGQYSFHDTVFPNRNFTLRNWAERDEEPAVLIGLNTTSCFQLNLNKISPSVFFTWSFSGLIIECRGISLSFVYDDDGAGAMLNMENVTIRNSGGGLEVAHDLPTARKREPGEMAVSMRTNNLALHNISCEDSEALVVRNVGWILEGTTSFVDNCHGTGSSVVYGLWSSIASSAPKLLFKDNQIGTGGIILELSDTTLITDRTQVEFVNNVANTLVMLEGSIWRSTGRISFEGNSAGQLIELGQWFGFAAEMYSLLPLLMKDNELSGASNFIMIAGSTFCAIPCSNTQAEDCDCNDQPLLSWDVSATQLVLPASPQTVILPLSIDPPTASSITLSLVLDLSDGLQYPQHVSTLPAPSSASTNTLEVGLPIPQNAFEAELSITLLSALTEEATLTLSLSPTLNASGSFNFFLSESSLQVTFAPPTGQLVYQPDNSTVSVSFPNRDKPDHTVSLHDPHHNHPLTNLSVTAQFATLKEVDQEGEVVRTVSLQDTDFVMGLLGNTSFNLNNALPFISFSADINSFTSVETGGKVNLTEDMKMEVNFTMFAEKQLTNFAGVEQVMAANSLKWSLFLSAWPFQHENHSLLLHLSIISQDGSIALKVEEVEENGVFSFVLRTENTEIPFNVVPVARLQGSPEGTAEVAAEWRPTEQEMVVKLPWFENSLLLDPDISLLVGGTEEEEGEEKEEDELWWKIVVPVVVVLVVAVVIAIAVVSSIMLKKRSKHRRKKVAHKLKTEL